MGHPFFKVVQHIPNISDGRKSECLNKTCEICRRAK